MNELYKKRLMNKNPKESKQSKKKLIKMRVRRIFRDRRHLNHVMLHQKEIKGQKSKSKCLPHLRDQTWVINSTCLKVFAQTQTSRLGRWKNYCSRQSSENRRSSSLALNRSKTSSLLLDHSWTSERKNNLVIMRKMKP